MWIAMGYLNDYTIKSMNEWMNDILSKNWLTISIHYSQPMICKSVTRMSFIHSFNLSILFYSIFIHSIIFDSLWFGWLIEWLNQPTNHWMNEWTNEWMKDSLSVEWFTKQQRPLSQPMNCNSASIMSSIQSIICSCF